MEKLKLRCNALCQALKTLGDAIDLLGAVERRCSGSSTGSICPDDAHTPFSCENLFRASRDSTIQRFEYCTDLFWKYLKEYLERIHKTVPEFRSLKYVIRASSKVGVLSEKESAVAVDMVEKKKYDFAYLS